MPFGAHPSPCRGYLPEWGYAEDEQFLLEFRNASKQLPELDAWAKNWVLGVDHEQYLSRLGKARLDMLCKRASPDAWKVETEKCLPEIDFNAPPSPTEQMIATMAQICADGVRQRGYKTILAGQGTSNLAAWLVYYQLAEEGVDVDLMAEIGFYGYSPRPPQPLIFNFANIATCKGVGSALDVLGIHVTGARRKECIGMLGAAIVDRFGNVDSTCVPETKTWLLGSGGANEVLSGAAEVILCCPHDIRRLWPQVPYVTGPGDRVTALVTTRGVFRKASKGDTFRLEAVFTASDSSHESIQSMVSGIAENTGWPVESSDGIRLVPPASPSLLQLLRSFDPIRYYLR
jgi:acyl CoA:acetate/3-ketoacid CoA transferase beta subunit